MECDAFRWLRLREKTGDYWASDREKQTTIGQAIAKKQATIGQAMPTAGYAYATIQLDFTH